MVAVAAVLIYLTVRLIERRGTKAIPKPKPRPLGPDDDPDFLWDLDKKKRHRKKPPPPESDDPDDQATPA